MKDLDQSDVEADASRMFDNYLENLPHWDDLSLQRERYIWGGYARQGDLHGVAILATIDYARSQVGQLEMMGSAMAADWGDYERDAYNREAEEEMLGRPLFPNEY
jgi:hypothetical protein